MSEESVSPPSDEGRSAHGVTVGKVFLFGANALLLAVSFALLKNWTGSCLAALSLAILLSAFYIIAGAYFIGWAEELYKWGFPAESRSWSTEFRLMCGAVWPLVFAFCLVVALFNRVVTTLYGRK